MKKLYLKTLLLAGLAAAPLLASAEEWRLGSRHEIYIRHPGERAWRLAPGSARIINDGWAIGTDRVYGGYGIYRWNGYGWDRAPGAAVQIGGSYLSPWVINDRGERFTWNGYDWRHEVVYGIRVGRERNEHFREERRRDEWRERDRDHDGNRDNDRDRDHDRDRDRDDRRR